MELNATPAATDRETRRTLALRLLTEACAAHKKGKAGVAIRLGVSRTLLARVLSPNDKAGLSEKLAKTIIDRLYVIPECPATGHPQPRSECNRLACNAAPTHNPLAMRIWKVCQTCPHKPEPVKQGGKQ